MTEELGNQIQDMFKSIYDAADLKYMRVIKVLLHIYVSIFYLMYIITYL